MQRRPIAAKYGKNKGRSIGVNFFGDTTTEAVLKAPASKQFPISPHSVSSDVGSSQDDAIPLKPPSPSRSGASRPAHVTQHSRSSVSPVKTSTPAEPSAFEMLSSEDEWHATDDRPVKRRKMAQILKQTKPSQRADAKTEKSKASISKANGHGKVLEAAVMKSATTKSTQNNVVDHDATTDVLIEEETSRPLKKKVSNLANSEDFTKSARVAGSNGQLSKQTMVKSTAQTRGQASDIAAEKPKSRTKLKTLKGSKKVQSNVDNGSAPIVVEQEDSLDHEAWELGQHESNTRKFVRTKFDDHPRTPKKARNSRNRDDDEMSVASVGTPGSIGMTDLRLSQSPVPISSRSPSLSIAAESPRPRGRQRRIDRLDAPRLSQSKSAEREMSLNRRRSILRSNVKQTLEQPHSPDQLTRPTLGRADSSSRAGYSRSRATYGRERSHLADMVGELGMLSQESSSQDVSQKLASQLAMASQSQTSIDLELQDSSSDDAVASFKVKSIHELRQAGSNDRNERDLEGLLADIDPKSKLITRASRLTACMKLFLQLSEERFTSFVLDRGLDRLSTWSKSIQDNVPRLILVMCFWRLVQTKTISSAKASTLVQAVTTNGSLITHLEPMTKLAKERKEKLTDRAVRDLQDFEDTVLRRQLLPAYEGDHIIPAAVMLAALNDSMRRLVESGVLNISIGTESYRKIIFSMLPLASTSVRIAQDQNRFIAKLALSLLQLFTGPLENDLGLNSKEYVELGNILSSILGHSIEVYDDLVQAVLHFAISLCNDRPNVCEQVNKSAFPGAVMTLVDKRFILLVDNAESGALVTGAGLDSIILGLACLLNLTEHDLEVRKSLAHDMVEDTDDTTVLKKLVNIYKGTAPRLAGAITEEQAQVLPAFGYLSLLICNLCVNEDVWTETSGLLGDMSISDVVVSAKEMIIHMQNVDMDRTQLGDTTEIEPEASALDGFTQRFSAILAAVRVA